MVITQFIQEKNDQEGNRKRIINFCGLSYKFYSLGEYVAILVYNVTSQGHGISSLTLSVLLHRMEACKVPQWSRLGRLRRTKVPNSQAGAHVMCCGRLVCDIRLSCQELVRMRSYDLTGGWG